MPSSSRPSPRSKLNRSADLDSHSWFGRSRDPPMTSRSWWKQTAAGQPRHGRERLLLPVLAGRHVDQAFLDRRTRLGGRCDGGDLDLLVLQPKPRSHMTRVEHVGGCGQRHAAGCSARRHRHVVFGIFVVRLLDAMHRFVVVVLGQERPVGDGPGIVGGPRDLLRRHVGMDDQQGIGALGPVDLGDLRQGPGRFEIGDPGLVAIDVGMAVAEHHQIGLLGVELERQQPRPAAPGCDEAQACAPIQPAGRMDEDVEQLGCAVLVGAQIATPEQTRRNLAAGEVGLVVVQACHQKRTSTSV